MAKRQIITDAMPVDLSSTTTWLNDHCFLAYIPMLKLELTDTTLKITLRAQIKEYCIAVEISFISHGIFHRSE